MLLVSHDSKYIFSVDDTRLNMFSVQTGELVYRLSYNQLDIKSFCINPVNKFQLMTFHSDGKICLWDYEDGLLLKVFDTTLNVKKIINVKANLYAIVEENAEGEHRRQSDTSEHSLTSNVAKYSLYKLTIDFTTKEQTAQTTHQLIGSNLCLNVDKFHIDIDHEENYVAFIEGRKRLAINQFKSENIFEKFNAKMELTCLSMHPNEDCIATGAINGKIILWYNYLACLKNTNKNNANVQSTLNGGFAKNATVKPTRSILHWHSLPVLSLQFTPEGSHLLSGGYECVLVKWFYKSGQKDFRPRLGSPITKINCSVNNTIYVLGHLDNSMHLISSSNFNILQTISGFLCPALKNNANNSSNVTPFEQTLYPAGLNYFPPLNCIVANGKPGHLQFYSFDSEKLLFNLDIVDENYISPENLDRPLVHTEVELVALSHDSNWLATVERRNDHQTTPDLKLKFWQFDLVNRKFILNTIVKYPHSFDKVNKIKFKPNENVLFSCGDDGCFKSWVLQATRANSQEASTDTWVYNSTNGYRDLKPNDFEFLKVDKNQTLLAMAFGHIVTVWRVYGADSAVFSIEFEHDLIHCDHGDVVRSLKSIDNRYLLAVHENCVNLWKIDSAPDNSVDLETSLLEQSKYLTSNLTFDCIWSSSQLGFVLFCEINPKVTNDLQLIILSKLKNEKHNSDVLKSFELNIKKTATKKSNHRTSTTTSSEDIKVSESATYANLSTTNGLLNFVSVPSAGLNQDDTRKRTADIYYCDNRGILKRLFEQNDAEQSTSQQQGSNVKDVQMNEIMFVNRAKMQRNLPESNLAKLIDYSLANSDADLQIGKKQPRDIDDSRNYLFDENFKKIESTPAFLLPNLNSFCYETLKSMLFKIDNNKKFVNSNNNVDNI